MITTKRLAIRDERGEPQYLLGVIEDVTERKRAEERLAYMARHDPLTDLPNRSAFSEHLDIMVDRAAKAGESFALLCIDLDRFKEINDVFGPALGDVFLRQASQRLQTVSEGAFVGRLDGDEFNIIVSRGPQPSTAAALAERLLAAFDEDVNIEDKRLRVSISVGIAMFPGDGAEAATLLANANAALYRAKAEGRGTIRFFEADMDKRLRERRALQHDMQSAIESGELRLDYQPQALVNNKSPGSKR